MCALMLAVPAFFGKAMLIFILSSAQHRRVASVHLVYKRVDFGKAHSKLADRYRESHRDAICLVELSSRPTQSCIARAHAGCFSQLAPSPANLGRRVDCSLRPRSKPSRCSPFLTLFIAATGRLRRPSLVSLIILLLILPIPFRGWQQTVNDVSEWQRGMLHYEEGGIAQRPEREVTAGKINRFSAWPIVCSDESAWTTSRIRRLTQMSPILISGP